jgi:hypothetical protein
MDGWMDEAPEGTVVARESDIQKQTKTHKIPMIA